MPRIIAGKARGVNLQVPGKGTRPTQDRVKEALFSALETRGAITQARVLDLFAGSGALGLEALSRGANSVDLVENSAVAGKLLRANIRPFQKLGTVRVTGISAQKFLARLPRKAAGHWDLVFLDPPYDFPNQELVELLQILHPHCDPDAWVVVERASRSETPRWDGQWEEIRGKQYGETILYYLRPALIDHPAGLGEDEGQGEAEVSLAETSEREEN